MSVYPAWRRPTRTIDPEKDPYFSSVSLLLHMNGSNGSTTFTDSSSNALTVTANGNAQISTAQSPFANGSSGAFGLNSGLTTSAVNLSSGAYTVELFFFAASPPQLDNYNLLRGNPGSSYPNRWAFDISNTSNSISPRIVGPNNQVLTSFPSSGQLSTWYHIAFVNSDSFRVFINGIQVGSASAFNPPNYSYFGIADDPYNQSAYFISNLRITKGVARYTSNFTPLTAAFPDY